MAGAVARARGNEDPSSGGLSRARKSANMRRHATGEQTWEEGTKAASCPMPVTEMRGGYLEA